MSERKTQMPLVYLNLHKTGDVSFLQKSASASTASSCDRVSKTAQPAKRLRPRAMFVLRDFERPEDDAAVSKNGMSERKTQMPLVYLNLHKTGDVSFLQKSASAMSKTAQPAAATASDVLRDFERPEDNAATSSIGLYERKTQMPMVYPNLHTAGK
eukprot:TRINITY_DN4016_c0_g1_i5.p1 TRINITY_DN4016_c0_g1~~TRINITY_DN4016_c0_g1_i5.p1  ORF type:complete len:171 (-),score=50.01 TRINITY_DN4016_c0_g1_i5:194-661(-)